MRLPFTPRSRGFSNNVLVLLVLGMMAWPAHAADFTWSGDCGSDDWYASCGGDQCSWSPDKWWTYNNWGDAGCGSVVFPGPGDNVTIGSNIELWMGNATIQDLDLSGGLSVHHARTLTINGDTVNSGELSPSSDASFVLVNGLFTNTATGYVPVVHGGTLVVAGGSLVNDGSIWLRHNTGMGHGKLRLDNDLTISGSGELLCGADIYTDSGAALTNAAGHTIRYGKGTILVGLTNDGTVNADRTGDAILLQDAAKTNNAMMEATNGGYLDVFTAVDQSAGGVILADGGWVRLWGGSITGGTLDSTGTSYFHTVSGTTSTVADLTNNGYIDVLNNTSILALSGDTLTNNGTIELTRNTGMGDGDMRVDDNVTIAGTGELLCGAEIFTESSSTLTNGPDHTIRHGAGSIVADLVNEGTVNADRSGYAISLQNGETVNNGTMKASNSSYLDLYTMVTQGTSGLILADGGTVRFRGGEVSGGTLDSTAGSKLETVGNTISGIADLTNEGYVHVLNNTSTLVLSGDTLTNNGTIELTRNTGMGDGNMRVDDDVTLAGTGELLCGSDIFTDTGSTLTNDSEHTIRHGRGSIGVDLINDGTVDADRSGYAISLLNTETLNNGTMGASDGAYLDIYSTVDQSTNGLIVADGGWVRLWGGSITGGTLDSTGSSYFHTVSGTTNAIADLTNNAYLDVQANNSVLAVDGPTLTNNGTIKLTRNTGMGDGRMRVDSDVTMAGTGELLCGADIYTESGSTLTNGPAHLIHEGAGSIRAALVNEGTVDADLAGYAISLRNEPKTNNATMEASDGGTLDIYTTVNQGPAGQIVADGGAVRLIDGTVVGGTLNSTGGSTISTVSGTINTIADLTNEGYLDVINNGSVLVVAGTTVTNNGTIELTANTGMGSGRMRVDSDLTLDGTGAVLCGADIYTNTDNTLTNGADHTIRYGQGYIRAPLVNDGTINADYNGQIIWLSDAAKTNNGTMKASNGGYLDVSTTVSQSPEGQIVSDGGVVRLRGGTVVGGILDTTDGNVIQTYSNTTSTVADATNNGHIEIVRGTTVLAVAGTTLTNNGLIETWWNTGMGPGEMRIDSDVAFAGTGEIYHRSRIYSDTGRGFTNEAGHTIRGSGDINVALVNRGTIKADTSGRTMYLNAQGAGITNRGTLIADPDCELEINSASLFTQQDGETTVNGTLDVNGAAFNMQGGSLKGTGNVAGNVDNAGGSVGPGESAGKLTVSGNYTQGSAGKLKIQLGGTTQDTQYDRLQVTGTATLDGELHVEFIDGFVPRLGQQFVILTAGSVNGEFSKVVLPAKGGAKLQVTYNSGNVTIGRPLQVGPMTGATPAEPLGE